MKTLAILALLALTGCAYHPQPVNVYGKSGAAYTAPSICAALTQCMKSEASCYYDTTEQFSSQANGSTIIEANKCVEVKKK